MYAMPGLIDMHGHIGGVEQGTPAEYVFKLWMAHGITTIRDPSDWKWFRLGIGARRKKCGKYNNSAEHFCIHRIRDRAVQIRLVTADQDARSNGYNQNAKNGADGIKFFGASPEVMDAAIRENKRIGIKILLSSCTNRCRKMECVKFSKSRYDEHGTLVWITRSVV
jgi:hypothetical protein